ncbi:monocarboxylate transporter 4-like [Strongylocentrotus purpuratus]|uniref:Uncharacterized protein n=1 Tax=Strongylocentrotus purpuratus TaxID=7668 RepID=A0A7M7RCH0_STRPU|nr:monocarboxylate transporter 4-like [Strongylocentrotus purpuratus]|eukprot:XP_788793.3 PREDICTED: monocarboxylate transporter 4-like [Strongylocentrotus purpuratus]
MAYMPTILALNDFFRENFVLVNTITLYGYTAGSMLLPIVTERSFEAYGYAGAFIILGGIALNLVVCGTTIRKSLRNAATNEGEIHDEVKEKRNCQSEKKFLEKMELGIPPSKAIFLSTIGGIGGIVGRTVFIILVRKGTNVYVIYITVCLICTISFLLDFVSSAYEVLAILAFVQGFSFFIEDAIPCSFFKDAVYDDKNADMAIALNFFMGGLGATCAGAFTGYLYDITQSFTKVFIIGGVIKALMTVHLFIVAILIKRRRIRNKLPV